MEATLIVVSDLINRSAAESLYGFFGENAPVFEEEVDPKYRKMFSVIDEIIPPDNVEIFLDRYVVCCWTCSIDQVDSFLSYWHRAGIVNFSVYLWADELEKYAVLKGSKLKNVKHPSHDDANKIHIEMSDEWDSDDIQRIKTLISLLMSED